MLIDTATAALPLREVQVRPASEQDVQALLSFTERYYGTGSNQANPRRMEWLFRHNPHSEGMARSLTVAVVGGEVVGSHWKMRLPWRIGSERVIVPSPHDLALLEPYRAAQRSDSAIPPGLQLALGALSRERYAALLGLSPSSEHIYSRFQCQRVPMFRLQKILSQLRTAAGVLANACGYHRRPASIAIVNESWRMEGRRAHLTGSPVDSALTSALALPLRGECHMDWDPATYRWRFFHPLGPKHFLLTLSEGGDLVGRAVFSYGIRRGAVLSRLVDAAVAGLHLYSPLCDAIEDAMCRLQVAVATAATTNTPARHALQSRGWRLQHGVESRFFVRPARPLDLSDVWGGAYDYGFDALSA